MQAVGTGSRLGRYEIRSLLGRGGMGSVWEAYDHDRERVVALKVLPDDLSADPDYRARFQREAFAAAALTEPHIVPIHDFGELDGRLFIDMRLVRGADLRELLRDGPLTLERTMTIVGQVASALDAAHHDGLVHRDVKPENIIVADADFAYLADFGIAARPADTRLTAVGDMIGSWAYMAPERFGSGPSAPAVDIYALGCVLFECLTGRPPYPADDAPGYLQAHLQAPIPRLPAGLEQFQPVIDATLAKDPARRPTSAQSLVSTTTVTGVAQQPGHAAAGGGGDDQPPVYAAQTAGSGVPPQPSGAGRGSRWPLLAGLLVAVLVLGGGIVWFAGRGGPAPAAAGASSSTASAVAPTSVVPSTSAPGSGADIRSSVSSGTSASPSESLPFKKATVAFTSHQGRTACEISPTEGVLCVTYHPTWQAPATQAAGCRTSIWMPLNGEPRFGCLRDTTPDFATVSSDLPSPATTWRTWQGGGSLPLVPDNRPIQEGPFTCTFNNHWGTCSQRGTDHSFSIGASSASFGTWSATGPPVRDN